MGDCFGKLFLECGGLVLLCGCAVLGWVFVVREPGYGVPAT